MVGGGGGDGGGREDDDTNLSNLQSNKASSIFFLSTAFSLNLNSPVFVSASQGVINEHIISSD